MFWLRLDEILQVTLEVTRNGSGVGDYKRTDGATALNRLALTPTAYEFLGV